MGSRMSQFMTKMMSTSCYPQYYSIFRMALRTISLIQYIFETNKLTISLILFISLLEITLKVQETTAQNYIIKNVRKPIAAC